MDLYFFCLSPTHTHTHTHTPYFNIGSEILCFYKGCLGLSSFHEILDFVVFHKIWDFAVFTHTHTHTHTHNDTTQYTHGSPGTKAEYLTTSFEFSPVTVQRANILAKFFGKKNQRAKNLFTKIHCLSSGLLQLRAWPFPQLLQLYFDSEKEQ